MKKLLIVFCAALGLSFSSQAQQMQMLPNDPAVRQGKLDNGMTYYIRHNDKPENRAEFYLATDVGAIQETPDQDGLAHFLEHMCFNGTKNFPGKSLLNWLESIGASFGGNVNAATGVEQTQYMLNNIPLLRESIVDSCLLVMHDYSHFVTCDPVEIDNERGVIIEERRSRRNASWRLHEQSLPYYYGDSKYAGCTLIGSQENLENFKPESLVNFYQTWYRPDLQALVVVGDIDVDQVEDKVKTIFADIPAAENPKPKDVIMIPENEEPMIGILTDPEMTNTSIEILWKSQARPEEMNSTVQGELVDLLTGIVSQVMTERLEDIVSKPGAPFFGAEFAVTNLCETMDCAVGGVAVKEEEAVQGFKAFLMEVEKMKRFGFTDDEISRAKTEIESVYETLAKRADTRKNSEFVPALIDHFFDNYAYMEPQTEYEVVKQLLAQITPQVVNMVAAQLITPENMVVIYKAAEKEGLVHPTEADLLAAIEEVRNADIAAPASEDIPTEFLDASALKGSKIKKSKEIIYGATQLTLKNGVKVILLPTEYEKDRIQFTLYRQGGTSLIATEDLPSFESNLFSLFSSYNGVADFSGTVVSKMLSGKQVSVSQNISQLNTALSGSSTAKDLETAFQLLYLQYTQPRFDADAFEQAYETLKSILPNYVNQPDFKLQTELTKTAYEDNPRRVILSEETLGKAKLETIERVTKELYKDAAGLTFIMVGDFDINDVKPMVQKYIGSLPKGRKAPEWVNPGEEVTKKSVLNDFKVDMQTPKVTAVQVYRLEDDYSMDKSVTYSALEYILDMLYTETLREDEGGTYGASVSTVLYRVPEVYGLLQTVFETNPSSADKLRKLAIDGLRSIAENGPTAEQYDKTVKNLEKNIPEMKINNGYWLGSLKNWNDFGDDQVAEYENAVKALTPEKVKALASRFINDGNLIEVVMRPDKAAETE